MKNNKQKFIFGAASVFGVLATVALVSTLMFARTLGSYVSGGITVLILSAVTYAFFGQLGDHEAEAKAEVKSEPEKTDEVKADVATQAPAASETGSSPSGFDEAVLSRAQGYFGEDYVKGINSQKDRVLKEVNAGFNRGLKDAIDGYESSCAKKMEVFSVNFKPKTSKGGGEKDV